MAYRFDEDKKEEFKTPEDAAQKSVALPVLTIDYRDFVYLLEADDLSEDQKREYLETLWNIVMMFIDMGFGVHPVGLVEDFCGKQEKNLSKPALTAPDGVNYLSQEQLDDRSAGDSAEQIGGGVR